MNKLSSALLALGVFLLFLGTAVVPAAAVPEQTTVVYDFHIEDFPALKTPSLSSNDSYNAYYSPDTFPLEFRSFLLPTYNAWTALGGGVYSSAYGYIPWFSHNGTAVVAFWHEVGNSTTTYADLYYGTANIPVQGGLTYKIRVTGWKPTNLYRYSVKPVGLRMIAVFDNIDDSNQSQTTPDSHELFADFELSRVSSNVDYRPKADDYFDLEYYYEPAGDGLISIGQYVSVGGSGTTLSGLDPVLWPFESVVVESVSPKEPGMADVIDKLDNIQVTVEEGFSNVVNAVSDLGDKLQNMPYTRPAEPSTENRAAAAAAISNNAQVINEYVDNINVTEIQSVLNQAGDIINAPFVGIPAAIILALGFVIAIIIAKKVFAR